MDSLSSAMMMNLQSIQQAISMSTLQKAMNQDVSSVSAMIEGVQEASPVLPPSEHIIDVLA